MSRSTFRQASINFAHFLLARDVIQALNYFNLLKNHTFIAFEHIRIV